MDIDLVLRTATNADIADMNVEMKQVDIISALSSCATYPPTRLNTSSPAKYMPMKYPNMQRTPYARAKNIDARIIQRLVMVNPPDLLTIVIIMSQIMNACIVCKDSIAYVNTEVFQKVSSRKPISNVPMHANTAINNGKIATGYNRLVE